MLSTVHVDLSVFHVALPWQPIRCVTFDSVICMSAVQRAHCFVAFPWTQWLRERSTMLRYTYIS